ncbi:MAG: hypothetical protein E6167_04860, partial [Varibaculum cambriense]|nr:hypothetical protein [Varibaculum cambriense]
KFIHNFWWNRSPIISGMGFTQKPGRRGAVSLERGFVSGVSPEKCPLSTGYPQTHYLGVLVLSHY